MAKGFNQVILKGGLTKPPEVRYTQDRRAFLQFQLACGYQIKRNGEWEDAVDYVPCKAWETRAEVIGKYCQRGSQLFIEGKIRTDSYEDKDGKKVWSTYVLVSDVQFCGGRRKEDNAAPAETMKDGNGDTWTRGQFGGWVQNEAPAGDPQGNFTFRDGPTGMGETVDIPF